MLKHLTIQGIAPWPAKAKGREWQFIPGQMLDKIK
jgi:hypothetical protein